MLKSNARVRGSKDIVQKVMLDKNALFADALNGFICKGEQVIKTDMLTDTNTTSYYKANGEIHGQDRDVVRLQTIGDKKVIILLVGIENQKKFGTAAGTCLETLSCRSCSRKCGS